MRSSRAISVLALALCLVGCLADFTRTMNAFIEGPLTFHLSPESLDIPAGILQGEPGSCVVSELACSDEACLAVPASCSPEGMCRPEAVALLSQPVDLSGRYSLESLRVDSVQLTGLGVAVLASSLDIGMSGARILWAPVEASSNQAIPLADLGPLVVGMEAGSMTADLDETGAAQLEAHLVGHQSFRLYFEASTVLIPGSTCPSGSLDIQVELGFEVSGEHVDP